MRNRFLLIVIWIGLAGVASADVWDVGTTDDDTHTGTQNELVHGSSQTHDVGAQGGVADVDFYKVGQAPYSSWEILVDSTSTDAGFKLGLDLMNSDGTTVAVPASNVSGLDSSRSLRFENSTGFPITNKYVRAKSTTCTTNCTASDVYTLRAYDTTYAVSRFNNSGTQGTVLVVQNTAAYNVSATLYFWNNAGTMLGTPMPVTFTPKQLQVLSLPAIPALAGASGSITISNTGRYGDLKGKATALEPSTGFSFDTLMEGRPQ
jgi:hypothetical protein